LSNDHISPRVDDNGVGWCDAGCPKYVEDNYGFGGYMCAVNEFLLPDPDHCLVCPHHAARRIAELEGAASADHQRMVDAASKAGVTFYGCDTADHMADRIAELQSWREEDAETIANFARAEVEKNDRIKELERENEMLQRIAHNADEVGRGLREELAEARDEVAASKQRIQQLYASHKRKDVEIEAWRSGRLWKTMGVPMKFAVIDHKTKKPLSHHDTIDAAVDALMEDAMSEAAADSVDALMEEEK
jgi:hypothetical protein